MDNNQHSYFSETILENLSKENGSGDYFKIAVQAAKDLSEKQLSFLDVIEKLKCLLLSQLPEKRGMSVLILSEILTLLDSNSLNSQELPVISSYFCEKLKDHHEVVASSFKGTLALVSNKSTPPESIVNLLNTIFNQVACQQQIQSDRLLIYEILEATLKHHLDEVNSMGVDFVYGVITLIDGERDPKNLIYLFNWLPEFLSVAKLEHLTEEMFDVLSCYFPIDFKPPQHDTHKITRESLAEALCKCLTCRPDFGQFGIPLALEKLDTSLNIAIADSLDILKRGCINYSVEIYYQHSIEIWSELQKKIFSSSDIIVRDKCLDTLHQVMAKLATGDAKNFENLVTDITDTLKGNMLPDSKLFTQSSQILIKVAKASNKSALLVARHVCPLLENTFQIDTNVDHKAAILPIHIQFAKTAMKGNTEALRFVNAGAFLCSLAVINKQNHLEAAGHQGFASLSKFLLPEIRGKYLIHLRQVVLAHLNSEVKHAVLRSFYKFALDYPSEVYEIVLYKDSMIDSDRLTDNYLHSLGCIVNLKFFEEYIANTLIFYSAKKDLDHSIIALKHINRLLISQPNLHSLLTNRDFLNQLLSFVDMMGRSKDLNRILTDEYLLYLKLVIRNIVRTQDVELQKVTYLAYSNKHYGREDFSMAVSGGLIIALKVGLFDDYWKIDVLIDYAVNELDDLIADIAVEILATIFNKLDEERVLEEKLNMVINSCKEFDKDAKIRLMTWITKSLVTRNHSSAWRCTDLLIEVLKKNALIATKGFRKIMSDDKVITKENHCRIMNVYKQKFFVYCINELNKLQTFNDAQLSAVGYLIEKAPKMAIVGLFEKMFRLILSCLENCTEKQMLEIILRRITELVANEEVVVQNHLEDVLTRVLHLTVFKTSMNVRIASIQFLKQIVSTYKVYQLLSFKQKVVNQLGKCVDDKKRLVRKEAMECRSMWYLLDAPV